MRMKSEIAIRPLRPHEEDQAYRLILDVFDSHVALHYSPQGRDTFPGMLSSGFLGETGPTGFTLVAESEEGLVGVLSVIKTNRMALLFVDVRYHGRAMGRSLVEADVSECLTNDPILGWITVSSTPNATLFYGKLGFAKRGEEVDENGMRFIPMKREIKN